MAQWIEDDDTYGDEWIMVTGAAHPRDASPVAGSSTTSFTVDRVYRGQVAERIQLFDGWDAACQMIVDTVGREFIAARLTEQEGVYDPSSCSSFSITPALQAELDAASEGTAPIGAEDSGPNIPYIPIAFIAGAAAILIAAVFAVRRRGPRRDHNP
jgi:hypothetical protein